MLVGVQREELIWYLYNFIRLLNNLFKVYWNEKMLTSLVMSWRRQLFCNKEISKNPKNGWKSMKIANIDREIVHNFWTTWENSMKFSEKMWRMIILKVTKNQDFTLSLEDTFFEIPQRESNWSLLSRFRVNIEAN